MRLNSNTVLVGTHCILVPYCQEHVLKYHEWMKDPALLEATGSEPLTLDEEYDMQKSWRDDPKKCTFIVLARDRVSEQALANLEQNASHSQDGTFVSNTLSAMAGDVNLFLSEIEEEDQDSNAGKHESEKEFKQAELDIMVAEISCQRKGIGREACCMMMMYAAKSLAVQRFFCKINEDNQASFSLFRALGFEQCAYAACFQQLELELKKDSSEEMVDALICLPKGGDLISYTCACP
jgi:RimJ/RimL family protein N-acetyltransferase